MTELRILGPLELRGPTGSAGLGGDKPRRLLGALALHAGEVVAADRLIDLAWGASPPRSAHANLLTYLSSLRRALRPSAGLGIEALPPGYRLLGDSGSLDWLRFLELAEAAREVDPGDPGKAGLLLREALGLWRGPVLADVADGLTLLQPRIAALEEARLSAQVRCIDADLCAGRHADVVGELAELTCDHPLHEQLRGQHMLALYRCGRQADALAVFHQLREHLADELGVDPGPGLGRLYEAILRADPQLDHAPTPGLPDVTPSAARASPVTPPRQLPGGVSAFTGRRDELGRLNEFLAGEQDSMLVAVISGPPGVGKTALALRWAHRVQGRFPDGTLFADLRGYVPERAPRTAGEVLDGFLRALGVRDIPASEEERAAAFRTTLNGKSVLIVLDNAASASQVRPLLPGSPGCLVLVTSRSQLSGLAIREGAASVALDPLAEPEAVALLRRLISSPRVDAEPGAAAGLARLCGGLPLALRIAAERAAIRPGLRLAVLASQLSAERDRLDMLASVDDGPVAVRSAFSCSYRAVCGPGARMFRLLGLHPGADVSEGAAAALAGLPVAHARRLLDGLTAMHLPEKGPPGRFRLAIRHDSGDLAGQAETLLGLADLLGEQGAASAATDAWHQALETYRRAGDQRRAEAPRSRRRPRVSPRSRGAGIRIECLKACLNGGRDRQDHPAAPLTPAELAASAAGAVAAGAEAVHLHPRRADGGESLQAADVAAAVAAVRQACPATPVGVSTGLWITGGDLAARRSAVAEWAGLPAAARPDFASVNLSESGWAELCGVLASAGVAAEAGIWSVADASQLAAAGGAVDWLRVLVEVADVPAGKAVAVADGVLRRLDELDVTAPRLLHGEGPTCWPLIAHAGMLRLPTRIGLEDVTVGPDGSAVSGNAELTRLAIQVWSAR